MANLSSIDAICGDCWTGFSQFFTETIPHACQDTWDTTSGACQGAWEATSGACHIAWDATADWVETYVKPFFEASAVWFEDNAEWIWPVAITFVAVAALITGIVLSLFLCKCDAADPAIPPGGNTGGTSLNRRQPEELERTMSEGSSIKPYPSAHSKRTRFDDQTLLAGDSVGSMDDSGLGITSRNSTRLRRSDDDNPYKTAQHTISVSSLSIPGGNTHEKTEQCERLRWQRTQLYELLKKNSLHKAVLADLKENGGTRFTTELEAELDTLLDIDESSRSEEQRRRLEELSLIKSQYQERYDLIAERISSNIRKQIAAVDEQLEALS